MKWASLYRGLLSRVISGSRRRSWSRGSRVVGLVALAGTCFMLVLPLGSAGARLIPSGGGLVRSSAVRARSRSPRPAPLAFLTARRARLLRRFSKPSFLQRRQPRRSERLAHRPRPIRSSEAPVVAFDPLDLSGLLGSPPSKSSASGQTPLCPIGVTNTSPPVISDPNGSPTYDYDVLSTTQGTWSSCGYPIDPNGYSYYWLRNGSVVASGSTSYRVQAADIGQAVQSEVVACDTHGDCDSAVSNSIDVRRRPGPAARAGRRGRAAAGRGRRRA